MKQQKGFTLIELLVVIAIIAILSTVVMAGLNSARLKGRDARRLSDMKTMQKALDLYSDTCGGYPALGAGAYVPFGAGTDTTTLGPATQDGNCVTSGETFGTYMSIMPVNPNPGGAAYSYCSSPDGAGVGAALCNNDIVADPAANTGYQITFTLEGTSGSTLAGAHVATPVGLQ